MASVEVLTMNYKERYQKRKNLKEKLANTITVQEEVDEVIVKEFLNSKVDSALINNTMASIESHYVINMDLSVSGAEAKEYLRQFKRDFNQARFDKLISDCKKDVINSIVTPFGLGKIVAAYDKAGGNVTTLYNFEKGIIATDGDKERHNEWQRIINPSESEYKFKVDRNGKVKKISSIEQDRQTHHDPLKDQWKKEQYQDMKDGEKVIDGYTDKELGIKYNNQIKKNNSIDGEHVTPVAEIEKNSKNHLYADGNNANERLQDRAKMSGNENNLTLIDGGMNSSKSDSDLLEWANAPVSKKHAKETGNPDMTNEEYYGLDEKKIQEAYKKSKDHIRKTQLKNQVIKQGKELVATGATEGAKMGMQQALGLVITEFFTAVFDEIIDIYKNGYSTDFEDDRFFSVLKERLKRIATRIKDKWKDAAMAFKDGFISGFISNLATAVINAFVTTGKRVVRIIREGIFSLYKAVKILLFPPENMTFDEAMHEAKKIIASGLIIGLGVIVEQYLDGLIKATVVLEPFADILTTIFVGAITGLAVTMTVYYIDKKKNDKDAINAMIAQTDTKIDELFVTLGSFNSSLLT